jgi:protein kinase A/protein kinase X
MFKKSITKGTPESADNANANTTVTSSKTVPIDHLKKLISGKKWEFGDFDLRATVGTGTFGRVRVVKLKGASDRSPFALKILKKSEVIRLKQVEHVKAEKDILTRIAHPFIVNILTGFQDEKRLCMLLEYVNGGELFSHLRKEGRLPNEHAQFYAGEIVLAFEYLHKLHIVYRDLKPENLLIDTDGHIKITDFGFAKEVEDRTWTLCGTPEYLAPEIIQSKGHGKPVDWWALGVLIFEMLAGYPPFYDENPFGIYQKVLAGRIDFPRHFDVRAKDLIKRLLTQDRAKRYGCLKNGPEDIKTHKWYKGMDWTALFNRQCKPPFEPAVKSSDDTSMFDRYPESTEASAPSIGASDQALFEGFND